MSESPAVVYLEADDEITTVVRRVRAADAQRVIVVVPGRSRATSSAVALRLLARAGEATGREVALVGDALTRSLSAEAGLTAYATLDDARRTQSPTDEPPTEGRQAAIHVVRGTEETVAAPVFAAEEVTRSVPVVRGPAGASRRRPVIAAAAVVAILLVLGFAGAAMLPGATVTIDPATEDIGPVPYVIEVAQPQQLSGTAEASATVTATGEFQTLEPATGSVVLFNWTAFDQVIPAGTLVAAGEQAYETQVEVVVPRGSLTPGGFIQAGDESVLVTAAAPGPGGNVPAEAIDTILDAATDASLRGFPENPERTVLNPEATSGGVDETGTEITQADVDAAVDALTTDLQGQVGDALDEHADAIVVQTELAEPTIEGLDELAGTRDQAETTIDGSLPWEAWTTDRAEVNEAARQQFANDPAQLPSGHVLLPESIEVAIEEANVRGGTMRVDVTATGRIAAEIDTNEVADRIAGLAPDEAEAALEDLGHATVELWPDWVASVPTMGWRVEVRVAER